MKLVSQLKVHAFDLIVVVSLIFLSLALWYPTLYLPYHWDGAGFIINAASNLYATHYQPLIAEFSDFAHPPLIPTLLALSWQFFGLSKTVSHILFLPFLPILLIATYFLGKTLFKSSIYALFPSFLLLTTPVVLAELGNIYVDLPAAALTTLAFMLAARLHRFSAIFVFTLACLTKESVLFLLPGLILWELPTPTNIKKLIPYATPLIALAVYLTYHYQVTGWWFVRPGREMVQLTSLTAVFQSFTYVFQATLWSQNRFLLLLPSLAILIYQLWHGQINIKKLPLPLVFGLIIPLTLYALSGEYAQRYGLSVLPLYYLTAIYLLHSFFKRSLILPHADLIVAFITLVCLSAFIIVWRPNHPPTSQYEFRPPEDLSYLDLITVFRQLGAFASFTDPNTLWYGAFPENLYLTQDIHEYIYKPIQFYPCDQFVPRPNQSQLIVLHPYSPGQIICQQLLQTYSLTPTKKFISRNKWIELYTLTPSTTSKLP